MSLENLVVVDNPLVKHYLFHIRDARTKPPLFRTLTKKISMLLGAEAAKQVGTTRRDVITPIENTTGEVVDSEIVVVPILRAGLGMIEAILDLFPNVNVGYVGLQRDEQTAQAQGYYCKLPHIEGKTVFIVDPMLATGGSLSHTISLLKVHNPLRIVVICIVCSPEGVKHVHKAHPDVIICTASLDRALNDKKYILPGVGDYGDRLYGTE